MELPPKLQELRTLLGNIPSINNGGCGVAALAMYRVAREYDLPVNIMFLYTDWFRDAYNNNMAFMNKTGAYADSCNHVVLEINGIVFDSRNADMDISRYTMRHRVTEALLLASLHNDVWTTTFKRNIYMPQIDKWLGYKLLSDDVVYSEMDEFKDMLMKGD